MVVVVVVVVEGLVVFRLMANTINYHKIIPKKPRNRKIIKTR